MPTFCGELEEDDIKVRSQTTPALLGDSVAPGRYDHRRATMAFSLTGNN
jgi:hypothetical protein